MKRFKRTPKMTDLKLCSYQDPRTVEKRCVLYELGGCADAVSPFLCNAHAEMFQLIYKLRDYTDGNNNHMPKIETYANTTTNLNIPLFIDQMGVASLPEICSFATQIQSNFRGRSFDIQKLINILSCLVGISAYNDTLCNIGGWLNEPTSLLYAVHNDQIMTMRAKNVTRLFKVLFYYSYPSTTVTIKDDRTEEQQIMVENTALVYNSSTTSYAANFVNHETLLKWTRNPDCVATPIVLFGRREIQAQKPTTEYIPIQNYLLC